MMNFSKAALIIILMIYFSLSCLMITAQEGSILFHIKDNIKNSSINAHITITDVGFTRSDNAEGNGNYNFTSKIGRYHFLFSAEGYKNLETDFTIEENTNLNVDVTLDRIDGYKFILKNDLKDRATFEGFVYDSITGKPLKNVTVSLSINNTKTVTNSEGYYKLESTIFSNPESAQDKIISTDITFKKKGYGKFIYKNIKLFAGKCMINSFLIKNGKTVTKNYLHGMEIIKTGTSSGFNNLNIQNVPEQISENNLKKKIVAQANTTNAYSTSSSCTPGTSIKVGTTCSCNSCSGVSVMSLESYVQTGLDDEWIPSWGSESLKAGAVAYRTFGAYFIAHPLFANYDISSTTCKQVWNGSTMFTSCVNAATSTAGEVIVVGSGGSVIALIEYSAENNNHGCGDGFAGTGVSPCISDAVCIGKTSSGHGRGMCAWGSYRWGTLQNQLYTWILDHYYNPSNQYRCSSVAPCSPATGNNFCLGPPAPQILTVNNTCNYINGTTCQATESMPPLTINGLTATSALDVWYSFVATTINTSILVQGGTGFDPVVQLLDNACGNNLMATDATGAGALETINYSTVIGTTYYIRVYDFHKNTYASSFQVCVSSPVCSNWAAVPTSTTVSLSGSTGSFSVTSSGTCPYTINSNASWLTVSTPVGSVVNYTATSNNTCSARTAVVSVYDNTSSIKATYTVTQSGLSTPSCLNATGPSSMCVSSVQNFSISCTDATSYSWIVPPTFTITSGANTNSILMTSNTVTNNLIQVTGVNNCGASLTKTLSVNVLPSANCSIGINDLSNKWLFDIYPNPTHDVLYVKATGIDLDNVTLVLTSALGKQVYKETIKLVNQSLDMKISMKEFAAAVYFLSIKAENQQRSIKVIKQ